MRNKGTWEIHNWQLHMLRISSSLGFSDMIFTHSPPSTLSVVIDYFHKSWLISFFLLNWLKVSVIYTSAPSVLYSNYDNLTTGFETISALDQQLPRVCCRDHTVYKYHYSEKRVLFIWSKYFSQSSHISYDSWYLIKTETIIWESLGTNRNTYDQTNPFIRGPRKKKIPVLHRAQHSSLVLVIIMCVFIYSTAWMPV